MISPRFTWLILGADLQVERGYTGPISGHMKGIAMTNVTTTVEKARDIGQTLAKDEEFRKSVVEAYGSARKLYDKLDDKSIKALTAVLAADTSAQKDFSRSATRLQKAAKKALKKSHKRRNALILAGVLVGLLYNPKTGPQTRKWIKERISGSDGAFEYEVDGAASPGAESTAVSPQPPAAD